MFTPGRERTSRQPTDLLTVSSSPDLIPRSGVPVEHLLLHCLALGQPSSSREPAQERLEEVLGRELAQQLIATLTTGSRG
jgi:hypothetical protein